MRHRLRSSESGQALTEYAAIIAVIAIGCILAIILLSGGIQALFGSTSKPLKRGPFTPPSATPLPTSIEECENGGWQSFTVFADESECKQYVEDLP